MNDKNPIIYVARINENAVFAIARTEYLPIGKENILLDGLEMHKPYLVAKLQSAAQAMLGIILHLPENNLINAVEKVVFVNNLDKYVFTFAGEIDENITQLERVVKLLSPSDVAKILYLLLQFSNSRPSLMLSQQYWLICNQVRQSLKSSELQAKNSIWLQPNLLFIPAKLPDSINWLRAKIMLCSINGVRFNDFTPVFAPKDTSSNDKNEVIGLLVQFSNAARAMRHDESMTLLLRDQAIAIAPPPPAIKDLSESKINGFITYLKKQNEAEMFKLRGGLSRAILSLGISNDTSSNSELSNNTQASEIIKALQLYLPSVHSSVSDFAKPFGLNIEVVAPINGASKGELLKGGPLKGGLLIAGWIFDPLELLEHISITDDCGNYYGKKYFNGKQVSLIRFARADIEKLYADSPFTSENNNQFNNHAHQYGFMLWLENTSENIAKNISNNISPCAIRAELQLKSGLSYAITTATKQPNIWEMRQDVLKNIGAQFVNNNMSSNSTNIQFLAEKLTIIQQNIADIINSKPPEIIRYNHTAKSPKNSTIKNYNFSIIIPLYKRLEFMQAQIATFAADDDMKKAEIIYVLDSPNQAEFVQKKLQQFTKLYNIAITLLIMPENGGYALASNAGAKIAKGEWLVMMNSDILPQNPQYSPQSSKTKNWAQIMSDFLLENPKIGVVAPKLLYEDGSIQHAGMFFSFDSKQQFYENKHYYKGFPSFYPPANKSRCTPAVSAACIMINRKLFAKVGMFCDGFVVGDYEDSDLCLKLLQLGYHSFYLAEVEMLHFERQSMNDHAMNENKSSGLARYHINAHLHHVKWGRDIAELMKGY